MPIWQFQSVKPCSDFVHSGWAANIIILRGFVLV